ncbi:UPF0481 protein [Acorus gramineus]|uniref:UPF0481 protein n=1 Tax=Acorus gramineus TaxID=55184 RepID=A0AAV9BTI0_ACOGR|nr:UPF0481 protein [Acorus gramineus]
MAEGTVGEFQQESTITSDSEPEVVIEMDKSWVDSVSSRIDASLVRPWRKKQCSIFRVPANLRALHPEDYEPRVVSIGPYHHGKAHLEHMEKQKWRMAWRLLLKRREEDLLSKCLHKVKTLEERARSCYSEVVDMSSNEFTEMMFLDGCFLIGYLLLERSETIKRKNPNTTMEDDDNWVWKEQKDEEEAERGAMHSSLYYTEQVARDLVKMENQMPFFVVQALFHLLVFQADLTIYDLAMNDLRRQNLTRFIVKNPNVHHHFFHLFYEMIVSDFNSNDTEKSSSCIHELIDLVDRGFSKINKTTQGLLLPLRNSIPISLFRKSKDRESKEEDWSSGWVRSAKEMEEAGVKFVVKRDSSFLDASFKDGVMWFPILRIFEDTIVNFRNLIAFEQCYPDTKDHLTYYAVFMDCLIDTPTDVKVLQREGILRIGISDETEVAQFFNSLTREVCYNNGRSYLRDLFVDVNRYCDSKTHKWRAVLARDYFNSPWAVSSVVAAFILLVLTLLQTVYTMYSYYHS